MQPNFLNKHLFNEAHVQWSEKKHVNAQGMSFYLPSI